MKKTILEQLRPANMKAKKQIELLGQYLMENFGEEIRDEGGVEMAVRLLEEYRTLKHEEKQLKRASEVNREMSRAIFGR